MKSNKDYYRINPAEWPVPDKGLGKYIEGYSSALERKYDWVWTFSFTAGVIFLVAMLLLISWYAAGVGLFCAEAVVIAAVAYFLATRKYCNVVLVYDAGFVFITYDRHDKVVGEDIVRFAGVEELEYPRTRSYVSHYGDPEYRGTRYTMRLTDGKGRVVWKKTGRHFNETENPELYDGVTYGLLAIEQRWNQYAIEKVNKEIARQGFALFSYKAKEFWKPGKRSIKVGHGFIEVDGELFERGISYGLQDGVLTLAAEQECGARFKHNKKQVAINVNTMPNNQVFLLTIAQLVGIK